MPANPNGMSLSGFEPPFVNKEDLMRGLSLLLAASLAIQSAAAAASFGQEAVQLPPQQSAQAAKVKAKVQKHGTNDWSRMTVTLLDKSEQKGRITEIGEDSFSLTDQKTGQMTTISYADVKSIRTSGLSDRAKVTIGVVTVVVVAAGVIAFAVAHTKGPCCYGPY
jgi:hypothetical protein